MQLAGQAAIVGVGESEYSKHSGLSQTALQLIAAKRAIADAGLRPSDIDGLIPPNHGDPPAEGFVINLGIPDLRFTVTIRMGGATGVVALQAAALAVISGIARHVLIVAGRNGRSGHRISQRGALALPTANYLSEFEQPYGLLVPMHWFSLQATRYMQQYGVTSRQFGAVAVAMRKHAQRNPRAIMRAPMTIEDHQRSRWVTNAFRLLDCCIEADGASAVVVTTVERARDLRPAGRPLVRILGMAEGHPDSPHSITTRPDVLQLGTVRAGPVAFRMAGLTPRDVSVAQLYDAFTYLVLAQLEQLGFCGPGEAGAFVEGGRIESGGVLPVNTHGGVLSEVHGMSALNSVVEAVRQVRGDAGPTQEPNVAVALVSALGDFGDSGVALLGR